METKACKNTVKEGNYKASDMYNAQTQKISSTTLKMEQKYAQMQEMAASKTVCRYTKHSMQNLGQQGL